MAGGIANRIFSPTLTPILIPIRLIDWHLEHIRYKALALVEAVLLE